MRVIVTGGTGFVGSYLLPALLDAGHEVVALTRNAERAAKKVPAGVEVREYDPLDLDSVTEAIEGAEGIVNLAGHNLFEGRWNKQRMQLIRDSRVVTTRLLVEAMGRLPKAPKVLCSGSAIGFYGPRDPDEVCIEEALDATNFAPRDYLAGVCREWEAAARKSELLGTREVRIRIGVVLGRGEGALGAMELPFKMFAGGPVGNGKQAFSWIHVKDVARIIVWALGNEAVTGPVNATAPNPVTNKEFAKALGRALRRPAFIPTPGFGLRLLLGKVASILTVGQRVIPKKALDLGFTFLYATVDEALAAEYSKSEEPAAAAA